MMFSDPTLTVGGDDIGLSKHGNRGNSRVKIDLVGSEWGSALPCHMCNRVETSGNERELDPQAKSSLVTRF
jgi:hypothetical protein